MRCLIAGGVGFLGSHLADRLLKDGHEVIVVDDLSSGNMRNIEHLKGNPSFSFVRHDVSEPLQVSIRVDRIYHLASLASPPGYQKRPVHTLITNGFGAYHLLNNALSMDARFLFASTSEVYGDPSVNPQPESYWGNVNPVGIRSCYDEAKRFGEAMVMAFNRKHDKQYKLIRIFNTYGPRMDLRDGRVVPNLIGQALRGEPLTVYGDGSQTRSFCYVDDLIDGIVRMMESEEVGPINIGNPDERTIQEFAQVIKKLIPTAGPITHLPLPKDDPLQRRPDITLARTKLHWEPKVKLDDGLRKTIAYFETMV
ncbi:NAD-dependent dehydratase [Candidatus Woesearchaeota archaeon CG_4_10_14_0_2_um_filter_57_5]|nr:MAG: NAD-dependent dehydratase [Candidatus Woesearchaeota archaeon CG1_02_57_44]PIZ54678.1 MAG: NAD-dependent dehydratase [Candidatus Woesearchaeota archaeon CG_4_10_14_0_2_um_filter_57_5]